MRTEELGISKYGKPVKKRKKFQSGLHVNFCEIFAFMSQKLPYDPKVFPFIELPAQPDQMFRAFLCPCLAYSTNPFNKARKASNALIAGIKAEIAINHLRVAVFYSCPNKDSFCFILTLITGGVQHL